MSSIIEESIDLLGKTISEFVEKRDLTEEMLERVVIQMYKCFTEGKMEGLAEYAWWKDGVQYVGTCGTTLKEATERLKSELKEQLVKDAEEVMKK